MRASVFAFTCGTRVLRVVTAALAVAFAPAIAGAQFSGLFNTGVDGSNVKLALGATDSHYRVVENALSQAFVVNNGAYVQDVTSGYIWQQADGNPGNVTRTFRTTFTLATGFNPLTAMLSGQWSTDNTGLNIMLNGIASGSASTGFGAFTPVFDHERLCCWA